MIGPANIKPPAPRSVGWAIAAVCFVVVAVGARPYAGSWNDGSRLAAVESLVDRHTFAIDESIFCKPSNEWVAAQHPPYPPDQADLFVNGTYDKLFIGGHFYSDKPAVIALLMAGFYQFAQWLGLPPAALRPDLFCWLLTVATSGLAFAVATVCLYRLGEIVGLFGATLWAWLGVFVLGTLALPYTRHVNGHILQLGAVAAICLQLARLAGDQGAGIPSKGQVALLGTLAGLGFNLDFGSGPLLCVAVFGSIAYRCRSIATLAVFVVAALPWIAAGVICNFAIGGVWRPIGMVAEYSDWPGSAFTPANLTGFSRHGPLALPMYAFELLFGGPGFFLYNLPLLLALPASVQVFRGRSPHRPELLATLGWCVATWLLYSVLSNNYSGACLSIRWFVPFLAPGFYLLAVVIRTDAAARSAFIVLGSWGAVLGSMLWRGGPWMSRAPLRWPIVGLALLSWLVVLVHHRKKRLTQSTHVPPQESSIAA